MRGIISTPMENHPHSNYLKTKREFVNDLPAVKCCAITVQRDESNECGALCLYVLKQLTQGIPFPIILHDI